MWSSINYNDLKKYNMLRFEYLANYLEQTLTSNDTAPEGIPVGKKSNDTNEELNCSICKCNVN